MAKIRICIATYLNGDKRRLYAAKCMVYSLLAQTFKDFEIIMHHDGELDDKSIASDFRTLSDKITFLDTLERKRTWGHYHRRPSALIEPICEWTLFTNDDNYYPPTFLSTMLSAAGDNGFVYCNMVHDGIGYQVIDSTPNAGSIDMGSFIVKTELVKQTDWIEYIKNPVSDGMYAKELSELTNPVKVSQVLFVHN